MTLCMAALFFFEVACFVFGNSNGWFSRASQDGSSLPWVVSPSELRSALSSLAKGQSAVRIELSQMHDASEVLGEVFECLHRAELGREAAGADPQLPRRVTQVG